jgi:hypothetical protein
MLNSVILNPVDGRYCLACFFFYFVFLIFSIFFIKIYLTNELRPLYDLFINFFLTRRNDITFIYKFFIFFTFFYFFIFFDVAGAETRIGIGAIDIITPDPWGVHLLRSITPPEPVFCGSPEFEEILNRSRNLAVSELETYKYRFRFCSDLLKYEDTYIRRFIFLLTEEIREHENSRSLNVELTKYWEGWDHRRAYLSRYNSFAHKDLLTWEKTIKFIDFLTFGTEFKITPEDVILDKSIDSLTDDQQRKEAVNMNQQRYGQSTFKFYEKFKHLTRPIKKK